MLLSIIVILISSTLCKNETYVIYMGDKEHLNNITTGVDYYFTLGYSLDYDLTFLIYINKSDYSSNPNSFSIEYFIKNDTYNNIYVNYLEHGNLKTKTLSTKNHHIVSADYSMKDEKYVGFKLISSKTIKSPVIEVIKSTGSMISIANIVFFILIAFCLFLCILTLITTKACGNSDEKNAIPVQYAPIQSEIQIAPIQNNSQ